MVLGNDSKKIQVIVSKKDANAIEKMANAENRSLSNWVYTLIKNQLKTSKKGAE